MKTSRGFTLVELVMVVAIIGILAAIALPGYSQYTRRSTRVTAQQVMLDIAQRETQYFIDNRTYADTVAELGVTVPAKVSSKYAIVITVAAGPPPTWLVTATPSGSQASDGALTIDSSGNKTPPDKW